MPTARGLGGDVDLESIRAGEFHAEGIVRDADGGDRVGRRRGRRLESVDANVACADRVPRCAFCQREPARHVGPRDSQTFGSECCGIEHARGRACRTGSRCVDVNRFATPQQRHADLERIRDLSWCWQFACHVGETRMTDTQHTRSIVGRIHRECATGIGLSDGANAAAGEFDTSADDRARVRVGDRSAQRALWRSQKHQRQQHAHQQPASNGRITSRNCRRTDPSSPCTCSRPPAPLGRPRKHLACRDCRMNRFGRCLPRHSS